MNKAFNSFQTYDLYEACQEVRCKLDSTGTKVLYLFPEPGQQASLYLDRGYFWQEPHYAQADSIWALSTADEITNRLSLMGIGAVALPGIEYARSTVPPAPHLLLELLRRKDPVFEYHRSGYFAFLK